MKKFARSLLCLGLLCLGAFLSGCVSHTVRVQPLVVEPIHMTVDVTIYEQPTEAEAPEASEEPGPEPATPPLD